MTRTGRAALCAALWLSIPGAAWAEIAVSANDGKGTLRDGVQVVPDEVAPDTVAVIDMAASPPRVIAEVEVPTSLVGPPQSVAVARDESFALVTAAQKLDPADPRKAVPDDRLSVIDLKASPPRVVATLKAGLGVAGVAINPAGTLALVANRGEGTVSVFAIQGTTLSERGKIKLGDEKSGPAGVAFTPDGRTAYVTRDGDSRISVLSVEGETVAYAKRDMFSGVRPYGIDIARDGRVAAVGNVGGSQGDADTVSLIDLTAKPPRVVNSVTVGPTPEAVKLSPDGGYLAVVVINGSNKAAASPFYSEHSLLKVLRVSGTSLSPVAEAQIGHWCQGVAWSRDGRRLLTQCLTEREVLAFTFDGARLAPAGSIKLRAGPAALGTASP